MDTIEEERSYRTYSDPGYYQNIHHPNEVNKSSRLSQSMRESRVKLIEDHDRQSE